MDLLECRKELDGIDRQIVELFEKRMEICGHVAESKLASGKAVYDGERERQKLEAVGAMAHGDFNRTAVEELFSQMMTISRRYQYKLLEEGGKSQDLGFRRVEELPAKGARIVYQGVEGAYSHGAALQYFGDAADVYHVEHFGDAMEEVQAGSVSEYADETVSASPEEQEQIRQQIPDIETVEAQELTRYQKTVKRNLLTALSRLKDEQNRLAEEIRSIAAKDIYAEDYFKKTFDSLLTQTASPKNLAEQYAVNKASYESQLEKLKIDLASIDNEQKNIEEMFLEYVRSVNANIAMIDKNSTISVRGRNIKMLKIQVADWESEQEHFRMKLHDYFEQVIQNGLDTIDKNENLNEFLGNVITTKRLYDDTVGIGSVKIKLYKIEAEREVPITWAEVSANSGGEGFLSAFVILTCLLSYMRRDESDLFTTGEEGKVLIMDNPFAQTNAEHLLKPLMEMAKKTNTQLICLSGLGGDSIYNRFDNIYVLKLMDSSIRSGAWRMEASHIKGESVKRMVLSEFRVEERKQDWK